MNEHRRCFWGDAASPEPLKIRDDIFQLMLKWPSGHGHGNIIFGHQDLQHPEDIFKLHLFKTMSVFLGTTVEQDVSSWVKPHIHLGVQLSELPLPDWRVLGWFGLAGARLFNNGALELSAAWSGNTPRKLGFRHATVAMKLWRARRIGPFAGLVFRRDKPLQGSQLDEEALQKKVDETGVAADVIRRQTYPTKIDVGVMGGLGATYYVSNSL